MVTLPKLIESQQIMKRKSLIRKVNTKITQNLYAMEKA